MINKRMLVAGVLSIINLFLVYVVFIFAIDPYLIQWEIFVFFPLIIGGIVYYWANKKKKYDALKSFIYFNIAFFLSLFVPLGLIILFYIFTPPMSTSMYGVQPMYGVPMPAPEYGVQPMYGVGMITGTVLFGFKARIYLIMDSIKKLFRKI